jgi:N-acetylneuraminic acid mutarotase
MRWTSSSAGGRIASIFTAGLLAILGCREDVASPNAPEPAAGVTSAATSLALASNTWSARAPIYPHTNFSVGAAPDAAGQWFVYVFGGKDEESSDFTSFKYNVATNTWAGAGALLHAANMNGVGRIGNRLYMTGGENYFDVDFETFNTTWAYDIGTKQLFQKADMPRATKYGVTGAIKGKLYVLAGYCSGETTDPGHCIVGSAVRQFYRYDPATNTWINRRQPPHLHTFGAAVVMGDKFYVVGDCCSDTKTALDVYDPVANTWTTRAPIPAAGERFAAAVIQSRMFVLVLTRIDGRAVVKAYSYDPATNTWKSRAAPPVFAQIARVQLNGQGRLFLPGAPSSYLYTP